MRARREKRSETSSPLYWLPKRILDNGYCCDGTNAWTREEEDSGDPWYSRWVSAWTSWFRKDGSSSTNDNGGAAADDGGGTDDDGDNDDGGTDDGGDDNHGDDDGTDEFWRALHGPRRRPKASGDASVAAGESRHGPRGGRRLSLANWWNRWWSRGGSTRSSANASNDDGYGSDGDDDGNDDDGEEDDDDGAEDDDDGGDDDDGDEANGNGGDDDDDEAGDDDDDEVGDDDGAGDDGDGGEDAADDYASDNAVSASGFSVGCSTTPMCIDIMTNQPHDRQIYMMTANGSNGARSSGGYGSASPSEYQTQPAEDVESTVRVRMESRYYRPSETSAAYATAGTIAALTALLSLVAFVGKRRVDAPDVKETLLELPSGKASRVSFAPETNFA